MNDIALIQRRLEEYHCSGAEEELNAIREILQEMVLAGLSRTDFFVKAAFHGGTQLRIFEGVRRFSEDLDFALVSPDSSFQLLSYLEKVSEELGAIGVAMEVRDKSKASARSRSRWRLTPILPLVRHIARTISFSHSLFRCAISTAKAHSRAKCTRFCAVST